MGGVKWRGRAGAKPLHRQQSAMTQKKKLPALRHPLVVGTVHTTAGLTAAQGLRPRAVDGLEIRLDALAGQLPRVESALPRLKFPLLLTARHPAEGGIGSLDARERAQLLLRFLPQAAAIDIELRSVRALASVMAAAAKRGLIRVVSFHDVRGTPTLPVLRAKLRAAGEAGADVVKIATTLRGPRDLGVLLALAGLAAKQPMALMGMGPLGRVSRLALAAAGSCLNYGFLDRAQVPGQWPAARLKELIKEIAQ
jgi:3-dehydroquinate dehydratase I